MRIVGTVRQLSVWPEEIGGPTEWAPGRERVGETRCRVRTAVRAAVFARTVWVVECNAVNGRRCGRRSTDGGGAGEDGAGGGAPPPASAIAGPEAARGSRAA